MNTVHRFVLALVLLIVLAYPLTATFAAAPEPTLTPDQLAAMLAASAPPPPLTTTQIAALALPSVVSITVYGKDGKPEKTGSGFVVGRDLIATNQHVVMGAHEVTVNFSDGRSVPCPGFVLEKTCYDLAIIACDTENVPPLTIADTSNVEVGESVVAVGSPEGFNGTVTTGIVSAVRTLQWHDNAKAFQITAPISHGSSGGPLLNQFGQVIGMNSFYWEDGQNLNFAYAAGYIPMAIKAWQSTNLPGALSNVPSELANGPLSTGFYADIFKWGTWDGVEPDDSLGIEYYLDHGGDANATDGGSSFLVMAGLLEGPTAITYLVDHGADIDAPDQDGFTPLMSAVCLGRLDLVKALIAAGADVTLKDKAGETALSFAHFGPPAIVAALQAAGETQ